jgi:hypothetical protein
MTLAQAVQQDAWTMSGDERSRLDEVMTKIGEFLNSPNRTQKNLFFHVHGFVLGSRENPDEAERDFQKAVDVLDPSDSDLGSPKKYREKLAEIEFHRGLFNIKPHTSTYTKAVGIAYLGDLLRNRRVREVSPRERGERQDFVRRQYWFQYLRAVLLGRGIDIDQMFKSCEQCLRSGKQCLSFYGECPRSAESAKANVKGQGVTSSGSAKERGAQRSAELLRKAGAK